MIPPVVPPPGGVEPPAGVGEEVLHVDRLAVVELDHGRKLLDPPLEKPADGLLARLYVYASRPTLTESFFAKWSLMYFSPSSQNRVTMVGSSG